MLSGTDTELSVRVRMRIRVAVRVGVRGSLKHDDRRGGIYYQISDLVRA